MSKTIVHRSFISVSGPTLLTALFVSLKAFGKIGWSWWWVFAPMWAPLAVIAAIGVVTLLVVGIAAVVAAWFD